MAPDLGASKLVARGRVVQPRRWCALRCTSSCIALPPAGADAVRPTWEDGEVDRYSGYDTSTVIATSTTPATWVYHCAHLHHHVVIVFVVVVAVFDVIPARVLVLDFGIAMVGVVVVVVIFDGVCSPCLLVFSLSSSPYVLVVVAVVVVVVVIACAYLYVLSIVRRAALPCPIQE